MKTYPLFLCLAFASPVFAQSEATNGYDTLVAAGTLILPGENGGASSPVANLKPAENLRRERAAVQRNAPALARLREALSLPIAVPISEDYNSLAYKDYAKFRELARQLSQEADVRAADGDYPGAVNSGLDAAEMGVGISRGTVISMLVGAAVQAIGFSQVEKFASHLDEAQCLAVVERLKRIDAKRPAFAEIMRLDQKESLNLNVGMLEKMQKNTWTALADRMEFQESAEEQRQYLKLTPEIYRQNNARLYGIAVDNAPLPYQEYKKLKWPQDLDGINATSVPLFEGGRERFSYERSVLQSRLLQASLSLRAQKLKDGSYPASFEAPIDPFSANGQPLIYKLRGDGYQLYSVGPDGKDNGGKVMEASSYFDGTSGEMTEYRNKRSYSDRSRGDVIAPAL
jgi:hypothetical protein